MGFFNKVKNILFVDDDEDEVIEDKKVNVKNTSIRNEETKKPIAEKIEPQRQDRPVVEETKREVIRSNQPEVIQSNNKYDAFDSMNERDLFKNDNSFPFLDFDEKEFEEAMPKNDIPKPKATTNVIEYEKKKKIEKKYDYGRLERTEKTEVVERKKFKPSPIISPVFGVLNEDYKPSDIVDKTDSKNTLDFNSVRKKAFGDVEKVDVPKETYYEETVTVKLKEPEEEKEEKVKTIDKLLEDTADVTIDTKDEDISEYNNIEEELEDISPVVDKKEEEVNDVDDDTLENDLFDLIDSMYEKREDGDY